MSGTSNVGVHKKILVSGPFGSRSWNDTDHTSTKNQALTVKIKRVSSQQQNNKTRGTNLQNLLLYTTSVKYRPESFDHHIHHHSTKISSHLIINTHTTTMSTTNKSRIVCCIGDIHGYISKLESLWSNLEISTTPSEFESALIIFLGDYCDRGPNTKEVLEFLISLPSKYPKQSHVFLCGNHDLAFAAFLGVLPSPVDGSTFSETWREYEMSEGREGWYKGEGYENMHLQGRRWAGRMSGFNHAKGTEYKGSIYDAGPTFESYGVPHGSADLVKAVPDEHKRFLADLVWVHEEDDVCIETKEGPKNCRLIAVHAGLEKSKGVQEQINYLKAKDTRISKVEALSGRKNVWNIPEELTTTPTIVVSGHHGKVYIEDYRLIIDQGGGMEANPIAAFVLPSRKMVRDTDQLTK